MSVTMSTPMLVSVLLPVSCQKCKSLTVSVPMIVSMSMTVSGLVSVSRQLSVSRNLSL